MVGLTVLACGVVLVVVGLAVLFGPWALVGSGLALIVAGVVADLEALTNGKHSQPPPR